jgi:hypothetical protein
MPFLSDRYAAGGQGAVRQRGHRIGSRLGRPAQAAAQRSRSPQSTLTALVETMENLTLDERAVLGARA